MPWGLRLNSTVPNARLPEREFVDAAASDEARFYREIVDHVPGVVLYYLRGPDGTNELQFASPGAGRLWKMDDDGRALDLDTLWERVFSDDLPAMRASIDESAETLQKWHHEWRIICNDGEVRWLEGIGQPERLAGGSTRWVTFLHDVTQRKTDEEHLAIALRSSRQGIIEWWTATNGLILSRSWSELTGYGADEMRTIADMFRSGLIHPDDLDGVAGHLEAIRHGFVSEIEFECRARPKHGGTIWILGRASVQERTPAGEPLRVTGTIIDITQLKRTEEQLKIVLGTARQGLWEWEPVTDRLSPLANWLEITGYAPGELTSMTQCYERGVVLADDCAAVVAYLEALRRGDVREAEIEFRIKKKSGEIFWALTRAAVMATNDAGEALSIIGTNIDISERKLVEEQQRVAATSFESHGAIVITDAAGRMLQVNPAFSELLQYDANDIVGQHIDMLRNARLEDGSKDNVARELTQRGRWDGEAWKRRKDGSEVPVWETITTVRNEAGCVTHCVSNMIDISERLLAEKEVERLAFYDSLTGLPNRRYLATRIEQAIAAAKRTNTSGAVLFLDLDQFKKINDSLGHSAGDEVLVQVAQRLQGLTRQGDVVSRLGGDEFVVLIGDAGSDPERCDEFVSRVAARIEAELRRPYQVEGRALHITGTMGVSIFPRDGDTASDFLRFADTAMYRGKAEGRNNVRFYHPAMVEKASERLALEEDLRLALDGDEFELYFQPQIHATRGPIGAEALLRWRHPTEGFVEPDKFIPVAEDSGLIEPIGRWVIKTAFEALAAWIADRTMPVLEHVSINVSSHQFRSEGFVAYLRDCAREFSVPPSRVVLELTERAVIEDIDNASEKMAQLRALGFRFSLDDFGVGYSSLSYLRRLPLDELKIDRSFVADVTSDDNADAIAQTIIAMGTHLGFAIIAEGVETEAQRNFLQTRGCSTFQGYYFCRPLPRAGFEDFCRRSL